MKPAYLFIVFAVLAYTPVCARIGDTQAVIEKSLGKGNASDEAAPFKVPTACVFRTYSKGDIWCGVYFFQGRSICECYGKSGHAPFSRVELDALLSANASGKNWIGDTESPIRSWQTEDKSTIAAYPLGSDKLLVVRNPSFDRLTAQEANAQDKNRIEEFFSIATPTPKPSAPNGWPASALRLRNLHTLSKRVQRTCKAFPLFMSSLTATAMLLRQRSYSLPEVDFSMQIQLHTRKQVGRVPQIHRKM